MGTPKKEDGSADLKYMFEVTKDIECSTINREVNYEMVTKSENYENVIKYSHEECIL